MAATGGLCHVSFFVFHVCNLWNCAHSVWSDTSGTRPAWSPCLRGSGRPAAQARKVGLSRHLRTVTLGAWPRETSQQMDAHQGLEPWPASSQGPGPSCWPGEPAGRSRCPAHTGPPSPWHNQQTAQGYWASELSSLRKPLKCHLGAGEPGRVLSASE